MLRPTVAQIVRFLKKEDGPTAVEYAVMLALIIVVCASAVSTVGTRTSSSFSNSALSTALGGS
ncbi:MAG: Flp family type IVb pilin [Gemmataceae bacterium]|nr:Flp family type IVb pilin [Gemmataceae bacterium]